MDFYEMSVYFWFGVALVTTLASALALVARVVERHG